MNIANFKRHTASRKPICRPLVTGEVKVTFPKDIAEAGEGKMCMMNGEVIFADLDSHNQCVRLRTEASPSLIHSWSGYMPEENDIRLSRFKTDYGGMPALKIRIWQEEEGKYVQQQYELRNGDVVKCAAVPVKSKGKIYINLGRDIIIVQKSKKKKRKVQYFSDQEDE